MGCHLFWLQWLKDKCWVWSIWRDHGDLLSDAAWRGASWWSNLHLSSQGLWQPKNQKIYKKPDGVMPRIVASASESDLCVRNGILNTCRMWEHSWLHGQIDFSCESELGTQEKWFFSLGALHHTATSKDRQHGIWGEHRSLTILLFAMSLISDTQKDLFNWILWRFFIVKHNYDHRQSNACESNF